MRIIIDTHIFVWYTKSRSKLSRDVLALFEDYDNEICISGESVRELIALWNHKKYIRQWWKSPTEIIQNIVDVLNITILYLKKKNIISHAVCNPIPLISDDAKFKFYRNQVLQLIDNE